MDETWPTVDPAAVERVVIHDATQRGTYGTATRDALTALGLISREHAAYLAKQTGVPADLAAMSAQDRGVWLSIETVYNATLRAEGVERNARTMTVFADLVPEAQQAIIITLLPVVQMMHAVALNPEARRA